GRDWTGVYIPTLDEVLRWASGRTRVVLELKGIDHPDLVETTLALVREYRLIDDTMLISFDHRALQRARTVEPSVRIGALYVARPVDQIALARASGADAICPHWSDASADAVAEAQAAGLAVCVWTANEPAAIRAVLAANVDAVTSDYPDRVQAIAAADR